MTSATVLDGTPQPRPSYSHRPASGATGPLQRYLGELFRRGMDASAKDACVALMLESMESAEPVASEHTSDSCSEAARETPSTAEDSTFQAFLRG